MSKQDTSEWAASAPFERILVGSIPTEQGEDALALALALARLCDARVQLVSVIEPRSLHHFGEPTGRAAIHTDEYRHAAATLKQASEQIAQAIGASRVRQGVELSSSAARGLHDSAIRDRADLIVVGSSHRGPVGRVVLGSVGEGLLSTAQCAVAVAPHGYAAQRSGPLGQVLVGFDGSPEAGVALRAAHALAKRAEAKLAAVTVVVPSSPGVAVSEAIPLSGLDALTPSAGTETIHRADALERQKGAAWATLKAATAELDGPPIKQHVLIGPDPSSMILELAGDRTGLLVLGSRSHGPLRRALLGSVSAKLVHHAPCPVLIMPRGGEPDGARS